MNEFNWTEFDAGNVETPSRDPVPAGEYTAIVTASEMKENKAGTGQYLALTFQVTDGPHTGAFVWANMNLVNPSEQAVQIARAELASLCKATGVMQPKDSTDLHDKPVVIRVAVRKDDNGNPRNEIKGYKPSGASPAPATKPAAKATVPPWKKK